VLYLNQPIKAVAVLHRKPEVRAHFWVKNNNSQWILLLHDNFKYVLARTGLDGSIIQRMLVVGKSKLTQSIPK
jgi:hypothetical protein